MDSSPNLGVTLLSFWHYIDAPCVFFFRCFVVAGIERRRDKTNLGEQQEFPIITESIIEPLEELCILAIWKDD